MSRPPIESSNSPRFRPTRARESTAVEGRPPVPRSLTPDEKKEFRRVCKELGLRHALTVGDGPLISLYCQTRTRWLKALKDVAVRGEVLVVETREGIQREKKNPFLLIAQETEKQLSQYLQLLGLTPATRERLKSLKKDEKPKTENEFEKMMKSGRPAGFAFFEPDKEGPRAAN
jgi:P27 family predicted phage terminase small subunit